jgi:phage-related protein
MSSVISVMAKLQADASNFVSGMKKAEKATEDLVATVKSDSAKIETALDKSGKEAGRGFSSGLKSFIGPALFAGAIAGAVGFGKALIEAGQSERAQNALLENIATSMGLFGNNASTVATRLADYAQAQSLATGVDEDAIKAGQAKLLTFSNIAKTAGKAGGSFDRATQAAIDLNAAGFGSIEGASLQLGKALQDPVKGMNALRRSGITFTDAEKASIKAMVDSGHQLEAQNVLLKSVEMQVGGSAEATATGTARMAQGWENLKENLATNILPMFDKFASFVSDKVFPMLANGALKLNPIFTSIGATVGPILNTIGDVATAVFTAMQPAIKQIGPLFADLMSSFSPFGIILKVLQPLIPQIFGGLSQVLVALMPAITSIVGGISQLAGMLSTALGPILSSVVPIFVTLAQMLGELIPPIISVLVPVIGILITALQPVISIVLMIVNVFMVLLKSILVPAIKLFSALAQPILKILQVFGAIGATIVQILIPIFQSLLDFLAPAFKSMGAMAEWLAKFITDSLSQIESFVTPILNAVIDGINAVLSFLGQKTLPKLPDKIIQNAKKQGEAIGKAKASGEQKSYLKNRATSILGADVATVQTKEVSAVAKKRDAIIAKMALAKDFAKKITSDLLGTANVTDLGTSAKSIIEGLQARITAMQAYGQEISDLKKMNVSKDVLSQILGSGIEKGGATATAILAGGQDAVNQINALTAQAQNTATGVGFVGESAMFNPQKSPTLNYEITVNAGIGSNGSDIGKQIIAQIKAYERQNGSVWKPA